jgi:hypothetical protein
LKEARLMGKKQTVNQINVEEIAKAAAVEALRLQKIEERQRQRKNRFHNTELLLSNYLGLVEHFQNSIDKASDLLDIEESLNFESLEMDDVIIRSIRRSKIRTRIMISQIDTSLDILRLKMIAKGQPERYEVIQKLYLDPEKITVQWSERLQIVAAEIPCGEMSVRRWRNEMIDELSILLFGVDGLRLEV